MDWEGIRWRGGPPFYVWRAGPFDWHVRFGHPYGSKWVGSFWTRSGAADVAKRLNRMAAEHDWSDVRGRK
jgi:hypothetical protein